MTGNAWWARRVVAALVLTAAFAVSTPAIAQVEGPMAERGERTIRVMGMGEVQVMPDQAHIQFAVETFAETAQAAGEENAEVMERVIAALVEAGAPRSAIETRNYSLFPEYVHDEGRQEPRIRGYRASNQVSLEVTQLDRVGALIDVALAAGANRVDAVTFGLQDADAAQAEALRRAVAEARSAAETMAGALGVTLGEVLDASTSTNGYQPVPVPMMAEFRARDVAQSMAPTPIQPNEQTVRAHATVVFAIAG